MRILDEISIWLLRSPVPWPRCAVTLCVCFCVPPPHLFDCSTRTLTGQRPLLGNEKKTIGNYVLDSVYKILTNVRKHVDIGECIYIYINLLIYLNNVFPRVSGQPRPRSGNPLPAGDRVPATRFRPATAFRQPASGRPISQHFRGDSSRSGISNDF